MLDERPFPRSVRWQHRFVVVQLATKTIICCTLRPSREAVAVYLAGGVDQERKTT